MSLTDKKKKSNKRSQDKNNKRFAIIVKKTEGLKIENYLRNNSYTINGFVVQAIKEKIERDTGKSFDEFLKDNQKIKSNEDLKSCESSINTIENQD